MESKLLRQSATDLLEALQRLTPEQRLRAFLSPCRLMRELWEAGRRYRSRSVEPVTAQWFREAAAAGRDRVAD
jgi:hypothetical protein